MIYIKAARRHFIDEIGSSVCGVPGVVDRVVADGDVAGVVMRIKPFLYLAQFRFARVTSMCWHAGQAIDAVWPCVGVGT